MARRSSGGRSAPRARSPMRSAPQTAARQAPPPAVPTQGGGSILGRIGSTIAEGFAFGAGNSVAHRAVDAVMGPRTFQHEIVSETPAVTPMSSAGGADACNIHSNAFQACINSNESDISKCQFYLDMLTDCRRGSGATLV